jgi:hypothetical protein
MSYISYNNILGYVSSGDEQSLNTATYNRLYALNINASNSANLQRIKRIGGEEDYYNQTGPKSATVSATIVPITGAGLNQITGFLALTGDFTSGSYIQIPSYRFDKCFLKSFGAVFEPWRVCQVSLQFDSYGMATGAGITSQTPSESSSNLISPLRGTSIAITNAGYFSGPITEYENISFEVSVDRAANYEIGQEYPTKVSVARITKTLQINGISNLNWISDYQPNQTMNCQITMADSNVIGITGVLTNQSFSVDANGVAKTNLTVVEEMV